MMRRRYEKSPPTLTPFYVSPFCVLSRVFVEGVQRATCYSLGQSNGNCKLEKLAMCLLKSVKHPLENLSRGK